MKNPRIEAHALRRARSTFPSPHSRFLRVGLFVCLAVVSSTRSRAQNCPEPWASAANVYGTITLKGDGTTSSTSPPETQTLNQVVSIGMLAASPPGGVGTCSWGSFEPGGKMVDSGSIRDQLVTPCGGTSGGNQTETWVASGPGVQPFGLNYVGNQSTREDELSPFDSASIGISSLSQGNSGKRSLWNTVASRVRNVLPKFMTKPC